MYDDIPVGTEVFIIRGSSSRRVQRNCEKAITLGRPFKTGTGWYCVVQTIHDRKGARTPKPSGLVRTVKANRLRKWSELFQ